MVNGDLPVMQAISLRSTFLFSLGYMYYILSSYSGVVYTETITPYSPHSSIKAAHVIDTSVIDCLIELSQHIHDPGLETASVSN